MSTIRKTASMTEKSVDRIKAEARARWDKLTDEDFDSIKTSVAELATRLQARYGLTAEEAKKQADEFMATVNEAASDAYDRAVAALDDAAHRVDQVVKDNAWATVGGALLLGGIIGYLMGSEPHHRSRW
ncbi:MAG: hypothetical protein JWM91_2680 [Rhodospirillales bacterium]|nr:hypothetical protein [Rhodospirillales bacterium]